MKNILVQTPEAVEAMIKDLENHNFFSFDTETDDLEGPVVGFSIMPAANDAKKAYYVSIGHATMFDVNIPRESIEGPIKAFFERPEYTFLGWNIGYDLRGMWRLGIDMKNVEDAQVMGWLVNEMKSTALKARAIEENVTKFVTKFGELVGKNQSAKNVMAEEMVDYAIQDTILPIKLRNKFAPKLKSLGLYEHYKRIEIPFIRVLSSMTHKGVMIDPNQMQAMERACFDDIKDIQKSMFARAGESFNADKPDQLSYILYHKMKLPVIAYTEKTHKPKTDAPTLERLDEMGYPIAKDIVEYSKRKKLITSFVRKLPLMMDFRHRIHTSFNNTGTVTGRLSSNNPNLQNIPRNKKIRGAFIPEPGKVFVIADYGQLELRVLAHFSQDKVLVDAFQTGKDPHSATAAKAKGIDYDTFIREMKAEKKILETYLEEQEKYRSGLITKVDLIYPDFDEEDLIYIPLRQGAKCVHPDTWIETENGLQRIGGLGFSSESDSFAEPQNAKFIRRSDGILTRINQTYNNGEGQRFALISRRGIIVGSASHKVLMEDGSQKAIADIKRGDRLAEISDVKGRAEPYVHAFNPWFDDRSPVCSMPITTDWAYLLGAWTGDGAFNRKGFYLVGSKKEPDWEEALGKVFDACGLAFNAHDTKTCFKLGVFNTRLFRVIEGLGFVTKKGKTLRIPEWLMNSPAEIKKSFFAGLVDTDGWIHKKGGALICTKDIFLAQDVCVLLNSIGWRYSVSPEWNKVYKKFYYKVTLFARELPDLYGYMRHPRKKGLVADRLNTMGKKTHQGRESGFENIVLVDAFIYDSGPLVDVSIGEPHLYRANGFITHNTVNFGIVYGGGAKKLGVSEDFIMVWKAIHGGASNYIKACHRYCERTCSIPTLSGRFRTDPGAKSSDQFIRSSALRGLFSAHIQGSAADIVKKAMINLHTFLQDIEGASILLQVHDELIVECYEADAPKIVGPMQHILENAYTLKIPLEATPSIGHSWADKK